MIDLICSQTSSKSISDGILGSLPIHFIGLFFSQRKFCTMDSNVDSRYNFKIIVTICQTPRDKFGTYHHLTYIRFYTFISNNVEELTLLISLRCRAKHGGFATCLSFRNREREKWQWEEAGK